MSQAQLTQNIRRSLKAPQKKIKPVSQKKIALTSTQRISRKTQSQKGQNTFKQQVIVYCIPKKSFSNLVRFITNKYRLDVKFQVLALETLQQASEQHIIQLLSDSTLLAEHARRVTVMDRDITLLLKIQHHRYMS